MSTMKRKYALIRIAKGDYLLPSNDAQTIWRIRRYVDGPSSGIMDWPSDREVWGLWRWEGDLRQSDYVDTEDLERWELVGGALRTRADAIEEALRVGE